MVTPGSLNLIRREGEMLKVAMETPGPEGDPRQVSLKTKIEMIHRRINKCSLFTELKFLIIST